MSTDHEAGEGRQHGLHHTPTSQLPHKEKVARQERHVEILSIVLLLVLAMLIYSAIFDLDSWAEWVVFGGILVTAIGAGVMVNTHDRA
jgi:membrane protein YdbS with pleckstrin-like domain